ncbi:hypothetical protein Purlil1_12931 [Purpureocillium lilacinum]|uniref:C2H2-type domain-containing protein n=1 Tax=Purpureocillium lilacinum TaxID=33203 RepID=A0ABR0BFI8_PURLI|nr:hypothetical protein Purlil1_12931 [Purpureocillium lilacinum]
MSPQFSNECDVCSARIESEQHILKHIQLHISQINQLCIKLPNRGQSSPHPEYYYEFNKPCGSCRNPFRKASKFIYHKCAKAGNHQQALRQRWESLRDDVEEELDAAGRTSHDPQRRENPGAKRRIRRPRLGQSFVDTMGNLSQRNTFHPQPEGRDSRPDLHDAALRSTSLTTLLPFDDGQNNTLNDIQNNCQPYNQAMQSTLFDIAVTTHERQLLDSPGFWMLEMQIRLRPKFSTGAPRGFGRSSLTCLPATRSGQDGLVASVPPSVTPVPGAVAEILGPQVSRHRMGRSGFLHGAKRNQRPGDFPIWCARRYSMVRMIVQCPLFLLSSPLRTTRAASQFGRTKTHPLKTLDGSARNIFVECVINALRRCSTWVSGM